jgi:hypothetical protein
VVPPESIVRRSRSRQLLELALQIGLMVGAALLYFAVRGVTEGDETTAVAHARHLLRVEDALRLDVESSAQSLILANHSLVTLANWVYIWAHWPVITVTLLWLYRHHRSRYLQLTRAMFISGAIGLVIFALYPVAPPRLVPDGPWVDTVTELSTSYRVLQPPALVNKYAALPSLHVGWNLLVGIVVFRTAGRRVLRTAAAVLPGLMVCAVVLTGNHYVLDTVLGATLALIGLGATRFLPSASSGRPWLDRRQRALAEVGQEVLVIDDQSGDAPCHQLLRSGPVVDGPGEQQGGAASQPCRHRAGEQAGVHAVAVHGPPDGDPQQGEQLQPVAR